MTGASSTHPLATVSRPVVEPASTGSLWPLYGIMFLSGMAGLGYEMVWTYSLGLSLGHEAVAVLAVLAAFFVGLGAGAWALSSAIHRSTRPHLWYAGLEGVIALWALALTLLIPAFSEILPTLLGTQPSAAVHWLAAFGATALLLLPATFAMGATLPAMNRTVEVFWGRSDHVPGLYGCNTLGAVVGILLTTYFLAPQYGFTATLVVCAMLNLLCSGGVLSLSRGTAAARSASVDPATPSAPQGLEPSLVVLLVATGFLGLAYEVIVVRILSQVLEDTIYTFALVLCVYLFGTAMGAGAYQRALQTGRETTTTTLLLALAVSVLLGTAALYYAEPLYTQITERWLQPGILSARIGELSVALLAFCCPTLLMGALFSHLALQASRQGGLGLAVGFNTLAAALAPIIVGLALIPTIGPRWTLMGIISCYLVLGWRASNRRVTRRTGFRTALLMLIITPMILLAFSPPLRVLTLGPEDTVLRYREGVMASVAVVEDRAGVRFLKVNNHFSMGSTSSGFADHRQTHLPLLLHPQPRTALVLGVGTGMSLNAAQHHPQLTVRAVELVPEVLDLLPEFGTAIEQNDWRTPPKLIASDARRFVLSDRNRYDVIIADLFHPARDGAGGLYTVEHFRAIRARLEPRGLFVQWLPLFQMDLPTLELIMRSFTAAFPHMQVHLPHFSVEQPVLGLFGSNTPLNFSSGYSTARITDPRLSKALEPLRLTNDFELFGGYLGNERTLAAATSSSSLNTDDRPTVIFNAPAFAYQQRRDHASRLVTLSTRWAPYRESPTQTSNTAADADLSSRLTAYWRARDRYLALGAEVALKARSGLTPQALDAATRDPLLAILKVSGDFDPAYLPLMRMVERLLQRDPGAAIELLEKMARIAPERDEARNALRFLEQQLQRSSGS